MSEVKVEWDFSVVEEGEGGVGWLWEVRNLPFLALPAACFNFSRVKRLSRFFFCPRSLFLLVPRTQVVCARLTESW